MQNTDFNSSTSSASAYENNTLSIRPDIYQTQLYAFTKYLSGGAFWNLKYATTLSIEGAANSVSSSEPILALHDS